MKNLLGNKQLLYVAKNMLNTCMKNIYYAHVYSHINYDLSAWGNMAQNADLDKIFKQQKGFVRAIKGVGKSVHTDPIFKELSLLKLPNMIRLQLAKVGYKVTNKLIPKPILKLFTCGHGHKQHRYSTRNKQIPNIIAHKSSITNSSFICKGISTDSNLPYAQTNFES